MITIKINTKPFENSRRRNELPLILEEIARKIKRRGIENLKTGDIFDGYEEVVGSVVVDRK